MRAAFAKALHGAATPGARFVLKLGREANALAPPILSSLGKQPADDVNRELRMAN